VDHQPRPGVPAEKRRRDRLIRLAATHPTWALGFADEVWWSRVAQPAVRAWTATGQPLRLAEPAVAKGEPKAVACYGLLLRTWAATTAPEEALWLRFVDGRPLSAVTTAYLAWCCERLAAAGKTALLLVWDNASWHVSREVRTWIAAHNHDVHAGQAAVRIVACPLPIKSPWLNPIEPKWVHGKRAVVEPARVLSAPELEARVYAYYACAPEPPLTVSEKAA
jgi:DDE superfamily endonuclease